MSRRRYTTAATRRALAAWSRGGRRAAEGERPKVYILLMHAWGMGGTIRTTLAVAGHLAKRADVEVLSVVRRRDEPFFQFPAGVTVTALDDQRPGRASLPQRVLGRRRSVLMPRVDRSSRITSRWTDLQLARALRTREPGVLIGTRPGLNMLVASFAPPGWGRVGVEHLNLEAHRPRQRAPIRARYPALDALVVLTEADRAAYAEELGGAARVVCIPNAVPDLKGHPSQLEAPTVVAAGRLKRQKGFDLLVPAFARVAGRHPGWRLRICGSGPQRGALAEQVASHGLAGSIDLPGAVAEMGDELASASVFVLSSRFEGFPMVLLEAMSKGLPVVSFDCPTGPSEVVEHGVNGLLVPPGDVAALSDAIATMIEDEELRRRCGHAALATAARYGIDAVGRQWDDLVAEVGAASAPALSPPGRRRGSGPPPRSGRPPRPLPAAHHGEPGRAAPPARP